jgi:hypothetical protein
VAAEIELAKFEGLSMVKSKGTLFEIADLRTFSFSPGHNPDPGLEIVTGGLCPFVQK